MCSFVKVAGAMLLFYGVQSWRFTKGLQMCFFILQVKQLHEKRDHMLRELEGDLKEFEGGIANTHLKRNVEGYVGWIRTTGQTATLKEIEEVKKGIYLLVRLIFF